MTDWQVLDSGRIIQFRRSRVVTFIAYAVMVITVCYMIGSVYQFAMGYQIRKVQDIFDRQGVHFGWLNSETLQLGMYILLFGGLAFDGFKIWAAIGLKGRKNWARVFYLIYFLVMGLLLLLGLGALFLAMRLENNGSLLELKSNASILVVATYVIEVLRMLFYFFSLLVLTSNKVKAEFLLQRA